MTTLVRALLVLLLPSTQAAAYPELTSHQEGDVVTGIHEIVVTNHVEPNWFARRTIFKTRNRETGETVKHCKVVQAYSEGHAADFRCQVDFSALPSGDYVLVTNTVLYGFGDAKGEPQIRHKEKIRIIVSNDQAPVFSFSLGSRITSFYFDFDTGVFGFSDTGILNAGEFAVEFDVWADALAVDTIRSQTALVDILELEPGHFRVTYHAVHRFQGEPLDLVAFALVGPVQVEALWLEVPFLGITVPPTS